MIVRVIAIKFGRHFNFITVDHNRFDFFKRIKFTNNEELGVLITPGVCSKRPVGISLGIVADAEISARVGEAAKSNYRLFFEVVVNLHTAVIAVRSRHVTEVVILAGSTRNLFRVVWAEVERPEFDIALLKSAVFYPGDVGSNFEIGDLGLNDPCPGGGEASLIEFLRKGIHFGICPAHLSLFISQFQKVTDTRQFSFECLRIVKLQDFFAFGIEFVNQLEILCIRNQLFQLRDCRRQCQCTESQQHADEL